MAVGLRRQLWLIFLEAVLRTSFLHLGPFDLDLDLDLAKVKVKVSTL